MAYLESYLWVVGGNRAGWGTGHGRQAEKKGQTVGRGGGGSGRGREAVPSGLCQLCPTMPVPCHALLACYHLPPACAVSHFACLLHTAHTVCTTTTTPTPCRHHLTPFPINSHTRVGYQTSLMFALNLVMDRDCRLWIILIVISHDISGTRTAGENRQAASLFLFSWRGRADGHAHGRWRAHSNLPFSIYNSYWLCVRWRSCCHRTCYILVR